MNPGLRGVSSQPDSEGNDHQPTNDMGVSDEVGPSGVLETKNTSLPGVQALARAAPRSRAAHGLGWSRPRLYEITAAGPTYRQDRRCGLVAHPHQVHVALNAGVGAVRYCCVGFQRVLWEAAEGGMSLEGVATPGSVGGAACTDVCCRAVTSRSSLGWSSI
jgi:hypothetical protein